MASFFYWVVQDAAAPDPTVVEIIIGQDGNGNPLPAGQKGNVLDTGQASPVDAASASTGLTPGTSYELFWVWDDGLGSPSNVVKATFSTLAASFNGDRTELVTFSHSQTGVPDQQGARTELITFSESSTGSVAGGIVSGATTESITFSATQTGFNAADNLCSETVTFSHSQTGVPDQVGNRTEAITFTESSTGSGTSVLSGNRSETVTFGHTQTAIQDQPGLRSETVTFSDSQTGLNLSVSGSVLDTITFIATQIGDNPALPKYMTTLGHFGEEYKKDPLAVQKAMVELEDEFILEIVLSLAVKGAIT